MNTILKRITQILTALAAFLKKHTGLVTLERPAGHIVGTTFTAAYGRTPNTLRDLYTLAYALHGLKGMDMLSWLQAHGMDPADDLTWYVMETRIGNRKRTQVLAYDNTAASYAAGGF